MAGVILGAVLGLFAGVLLGFLAVANKWIIYGETLFQGILVITVIGACLGGYLLGRDIAKRGAAD